jgi:hypothetical protein
LVAFWAVISQILSAFSGLVAIHRSSSKLAAISGGASGMKLEVKKGRKTGLGYPQPSRIVMVRFS